MVKWLLQNTLLSPHITNTVLLLPNAGYFPAEHVYVYKIKALVIISGDAT